MPNPRKDHAIVMARFAQDCMRATWAWTKKLEISLGPDTADLTMYVDLPYDYCNHYYPFSLTKIILFALL